MKSNFVQFFIILITFFIGYTTSYIINYIYGELEIYTIDNIYYVDLQNLKISEELSEDTLSFKTIGDLSLYLANVTAKESSVDIDIVQSLLSRSIIKKGLDPNVLTVETSLMNVDGKKRNSIVAYQLDESSNKYQVLSYNENLDY